MGAWVLMVGVLVAGVGGGVYIGHLNQRAVQPDAPRPLRINRPLPTPAVDASPAATVTDASALSTDAAPSRPTRRRRRPRRLRARSRSRRASATAPW